MDYNEEYTQNDTARITAEVGDVFLNPSESLALCSVRSGRASSAEVQELLTILQAQVSGLGVFDRRPR